MKPKLTSLLLLSFAVALRAAPSAPTTDPVALAATAEQAIETASLRGDAAALATATKLLDDAPAANPTHPALLYTRAFADFSASKALMRDPNNKPALKQVFEEAMGRLERVKGTPWEAEADALRGNILGSLIAVQPDPAMAGATLGVKSGRLLAQAAASAPASPRVLMFRGTSLLFTPPAYGGDPAGGVATLQRAVDGFAAAAANPGPHWGHAEALAWLGYARQRTGDAAGARLAWEQALALEPNYAWVKFALLPSLGQNPGK